MLFLIIVLPILGFLSGSLFGRSLGKGVCIITTFLTFTSFIISFRLLLNTLITGEVYTLSVIEWIYSDDVATNWSFCFDALTCVMLVIVTFISSLVHLYSTEYMSHDPHLPRFMSYLSLFTFFMLMLITANNFLQLFVGWEGVGVSSYLLINFWFTRIQANKAAIKAMLVNRVGDFFLLLAMFTIFIVVHSLDFNIIFNSAPIIMNYKLVLGLYKVNLVDVICIFLFLGAMGKSAQLGLHTWLPDAMEGPTPVSALIHAATMVTAGVFLIIRCSYLFEQSPFALSVVTFVGAMTAFFAATTGLFQNDMKRVIAYSTCSQLGYMIFACGLSAYEVGIFHLSNHAFFKALLFLGAGSVIHAMGDEQDMRKMGGLKNLLPFTYVIMLIGSLALIGFPFLAGFYSKDIILEISASTFSVIGQFSFVFGLLAAFCTAFYSTRLLYLVFLANPNGNKAITMHAHEGSWRMTLPLFLLAVLSILIGYLSKEMFIGFGTHFWGASIFINPVNYTMVGIEFLDIQYKLLPLILTLLGGGYAYYVYTFELSNYFQFKKLKNVKSIFYFFNKKWFFDKLYNTLIVQNILVLSYYFFYQKIDRGILEKIGPSGVTDVMNNLSYNIRQFQTGLISHYLLFFSVGLVIMVVSVLKQFEILFVIICICAVTFPKIIKLKLKLNFKIF